MPEQIVAESRPAALAAVRRLRKSGSARCIRESCDLSLSEVAGHVQVSINTISAWERCGQSPTGDPALRYLELLRELCRPSSPLRPPHRRFGSGQS
jgi:DNA-binding transcriptional regulator YiaG